MQKANHKEKGSQVLEFALVTLIIVPFLLGVVVIGLNLGRSVQVAQIGRDAGSMFVRGIDFSQTGNQDILIRLSQGLGMTRSGGSGVVILSKVTFIPASACTGLNPCNSNQYVVAQRLVVGNSSLRSSSFGPAGVVTVDSFGNVANYTTDANAVATAFSSVLTLNANEFAYVSETYFPSPNFDMPGYQTGTGSMPDPFSSRCQRLGRANVSGALQRKRGEKGMVLIVSAMMLLFVVIPVVGLAIDAGALYAVKAKLQTAVDGAALGAARSLSRGLDLTSQQSAASSTAVRWYHANFPVSWMGVGTVADPTVTFPAAPPKTTIVNVAGTLQSPTYFMRIFNINSVTVNVVGQATRRDVNIMMVIDRSGSIYASGSCPAVQAAASSFVNSFVNGRDRLGLITFGTDYRLDFPPSMTFATGSPNMATMVNQIVCYGYTNAAAAYWAAYQQLVTIGDAGALNVLLFFTDGQPNTVTFGIAPDGTDNRLPVKKLTTPSTFAYGGYDDANKSLCKDSSGLTSSSGAWNPSNFGGPLGGAGAVLSAYSGLYKKDATSFPASQAMDAQKIGATEGNNGGCAFDAQFSNTSYIYYGGSPNAAIAGPGFFPTFDIAYLPEEDINRNLTGNGYSGSAFASVNRYDSSFPAAYQGKIRVDDIGRGCCTLGVDDSITNAGINALDNAAQRVRADSITRNLNVVTYTIGLGNAPGGVNNQLLLRMANDPGAPNYNSAQPSGEYVFSPTTAQLNQAFNRIASDVLRLSK